MQAHHFYIRLQEPQFSTDLGQLNQFLSKNVFSDRCFKFVTTEQPYWSVLFLAQSIDPLQGSGTTQLPPVPVPPPKEEPGPKPKKPRKEHALSFPDEKDLQVYEALRNWRNIHARMDKVPPYVICSNQVLAAIAGLRPRHIEELMGVSGWSIQKNERYGPEILALLESLG